MSLLNYKKEKDYLFLGFRYSYFEKGCRIKCTRQLQCREQCIDHVPYYLSELSRAHFSDNLSRNGCIRKDSDFTSLSILKGGEICHLGLLKGPIGLIDEWAPDE